jgi:hypothetical protein
MNAEFLFESNLKQAHLPVSLAAAQTGARIAAGKGERVVVVVAMGTSAAATVQVTAKQHNAATGGTSKVVNIPAGAKYFKKAAAATVFTAVELAVDTSLFDVSADFSTVEGFLVLEIMPEYLDVNNNFGYVSVDIAAAGTAKLASTIYIVEDAKRMPAYQESI